MAGKVSSDDRGLQFSSRLCQLGKEHFITCNDVLLLGVLLVSYNFTLLSL